MKRVVVTGLGAITPIGNNVEEYWNALKEGKCGIDNITLFDTTGFDAHLAGEIENYVPEEHFDRKELRNYDRFTQFAVLSAREAFQDSKIEIEKIDQNRAGVIIGTGIGGFLTTEEEKEKLMEKGPSRVTPMLIPKIITNIAPGNIAIELGLKGISMAVVTACSSSTHAIRRSLSIYQIWRARYCCLRWYRSKYYSTCGCRIQQYESFVAGNR